MQPQRVAAITRRILAQFRHDRRTVALLFLVPLVMLSLFYFLLRGEGSVPAVGLVNLDNGPLGGTVAERLQASRLVRATAMDRPTAEARLNDGRLAGYVVFPATFTGSAREGQIRPEVRLEGSQPGPAATVVRALDQALVDTLTSLRAPGLPSPPRIEPQVSYRYGGPSLDTLDYFGGAFIGLVVFFLVFVVTCVAFLRERSQGTLERLMASPLRRSEIVLGYMAGFTILALLQAAEVLVFALYALRIHNSGNVLLIFAIEAVMAIVAVNLAIFLSMFARTEFQAVQFIPLVIAPQVLLSGIIFPVSLEPTWLQALSNLLPLTYAVDALRDVMLKGADLSWRSVQVDSAIIVAVCVLFIVAAGATLRRRIA